MYYKFKDDTNPFDRMLSDQFWQYSSSDIALTAIAFLGRLNRTNQNYLIRLSRAKCFAFTQIQNELGLMAPSIMRHATFARLTLENAYVITDINSAYKIYKNCDVILECRDTYEKIYGKYDKFTPSVVEGYKEKAESYIKRFLN